METLPGMCVVLRGLHGTEKRHNKIADALGCAFVAVTYLQLRYSTVSRWKKDVGTQLQRAKTPLCWVGKAASLEVDKLWTPKAPPVMYFLHQGCTTAPNSTPSFPHPLRTECFDI